MDQEAFEWPGCMDFLQTFQLNQTKDSRRCGLENSS